MPLPVHRAWRIVQVLSFCWCVILALMVLFTGYLTIYDRNSLLWDMIFMADNDKYTFQPAKEDVRTVKMALDGTTGVAIVTILLSIASSFAVAIENRPTAVVFAILNFVLAVCAGGYGATAISAKTTVISMTKKMFKEGVGRYNVLDDSFGDENKGARNFDSSLWRMLVDHVQIQGECCGYHGYEDYKNFVNVTVKQPNAPNWHRYACICDEKNPNNCNCDACELQHLPFSCCKKAKDEKSIDRRCAAGIFPKRTTKYCGRFNSTLGTKSAFNKKKCGDNFGQMAHVWSLFLHGAVDMVIASMSFVLTVMLALMAWQTKPGVGLVSDTPATVTAKSTRNPSLRDSQMPPSRQGESFIDGPQCLGSSRFAPQSGPTARRPPDSTRRGPSDSTRRGPADSTRRGPADSTRRGPVSAKATCRVK